MFDVGAQGKDVTWRDKTYYFFLEFLPHTRFWDKLIAYQKFFKHHRRLPKGSGSLEDLLFRIKTSDEILKAERQFTSDKEFVKLFVSSVIGDQFNVPTLAVLRSPEEVDDYVFEKDTVVKPTHASGRVLFVGNAEKVDRDRIKSWFDLNYYLVGREANYRNLTPKVIVEPLIFGRKDNEDIKFFCINGVVKLVHCHFDRGENHTGRMYDRDWNDLNASLGRPVSSKHMPRPTGLRNMITQAEVLAKYFSFVRIDMYYNEENGQFFVGEITHCHGNANERFSSSDAERRVSKLLFD